MAGTRSAGSLRATGWDERGLEFLACRHHFEACHRLHVACHHHAVATLGAVRTDSALFVCLNTRSHVFREGRR